MCCDRDRLAISMGSMGPPIPSLNQLWENRLGPSLLFSRLRLGWPSPSLRPEGSLRSAAASPAVGSQFCPLTGNQKTGMGTGAFRALKLINKPLLMSSLQNPKPWASVCLDVCSTEGLLREANSGRRRTPDNHTKHPVAWFLEQQSPVGPSCC